MPAEGSERRRSSERGATGETRRKETSAARSQSAGFAPYGPSYRLKKLLDVLEAHGETLVAVALNDYTTEIPITDAAKYKPILALKRNGEYMAVRDKGPIFIVYNYDGDPELKSQKYYSRSAWQVTRIEIR
jgi:hypothetical protein